MQHIVTSLEIDAPREALFDLFLAKERWKEYSAFVDLSPHRPIVAGGVFWFGIRFFGLPPEPVTPPPLRVKVLRCETPTEVRWVGGLPGVPMFCGEHYFRFEVSAPGRTRLVHGEQFMGLLAGPILALFGSTIRKTYEAFNKGLANQAALGRPA